MAKKQLNILTKLKYYIQYMQSLGFDQRAYTQFQGYDLDHYRFGTFSRGVFQHYTKIYDSNNPKGMRVHCVDPQEPLLTSLFQKVFFVIFLENPCKSIYFLVK